MIPHRIASLLLKKRLTLSVAESCTGGLICHKLTTTPGISASLKEGIVCYSNTSKMKRLGIPIKTIAKYGAVSPQICHLMAKNIVKSERSDLGLAVTGIAGPSGGTPSKPAGLIYIGISFRGKISVKKYNLRGKRTSIQEKSANEALRLLEQVIKKYAV
ncbi:MAG: CinA family protein [Planctomycetota bacterium]